MADDNPFAVPRTPPVAQREPDAATVTLAIREPTFAGAQPLLQQVLTSLRTLELAYRTAPPPVVNVDAPSVTVPELDLSGLTDAIESLPTAATAQDIADAVGRSVERVVATITAQPRTDPEVTSALSEVSKALKGLDFRLKGTESHGGGGGPSITPAVDAIKALQTTVSSGQVSVPYNITRDAFNALDNTKWNFNNIAASDLLYIGGNVASASWVSIVKSALVTDTYSEIVSVSSYPQQLLGAVGLTISQRISGQNFGFDAVGVDAGDNVLTNRTVADIALANTPAVVTTANIPVFTTATAHGLLPGDPICISGCSDSRLNQGLTLVTSIPTPTTFTTSNTLAVASYTVGAAGMVRFAPLDEYAMYIASLHYQGTSSTNVDTVTKNGDRQPEVNNWNAVSAASNALIPSENGLNYSNVSYVYPQRAGFEYIMRVATQETAFTIRSIDSAAIPSASYHRSHNNPDATRSYKWRFRARNMPTLIIPSGYITAAVKTGTTTATLTIPSHGLTTGDFIQIYGVRDQTNFANLTTSTVVASVVDANTITIAFGTAVSLSSYGGAVFRIQGQQTVPTISSSSIQSYARVSDVRGDRLSVVFLATPSTPVVGEVWTLYGLVDSTNTAQPALFGRYRLEAFNTTTFTLELTPLDGQVISGVSTSPANAGGTLVKNTELRMHFFRSENKLPTSVEVQGGEGNLDFSKAMPMILNTSSSINAVTTVTTVSTVTNQSQMSGYAIKDSLLNGMDGDRWANTVRRLFS